MDEISKDTLWKGIIEDLFGDFCHYFFPTWSAEVADFSKPPEFLDKELEAIYPEKSAKKRYADKLVKVFTKEGTTQWILIHIEVQGYKDPDFPQRMFTYFHRILDRYKQKVMALAIFTDANSKYLPNQYTYEYQSTKATYEFETFKLLEKTEEELNLANNPFSIVMLVAKKALLKRNLNDSQQLVWKKELVIALKEANFSKEKIRQILDFIRFYVKFNKPDNLGKLDSTIQITFKQRKNMGIEEAIIEEIKEKTEERVTKEVTQQVTQQIKVNAIQKALQRGKLSLQEITEDFDVSIDFVLEVQQGKL